MFAALRDTLQAAQAPTLEEGATLTVKYTGEGTPSQRGFNPPKLFAVTYTAPTDEQRAALAPIAPQNSGYGFDEEPF
jgi:hypothetical protein